MPTLPVPQGEDKLSKYRRYLMKEGVGPADMVMPMGVVGEAGKAVTNQLWPKFRAWLDSGAPVEAIKTKLQEEAAAIKYLMRPKRFPGNIGRSAEGARISRSNGKAALEQVQMALDELGKLSGD